MSYQQHVDNTEQNINCNISQSKKEKIYSQEALNPNTDGESKCAELSHSRLSDLFILWLACGIK